MSCNDALFCQYIGIWQPGVHDCIIVRNPKKVTLEDNSEGKLLDGESDVPEEDEDQMVIESC